MKTLSIVVREVCNEMCEEYVADSSFTPDEWKLLTDGFYTKWNFPKLRCYH